MKYKRACSCLVIFLLFVVSFSFKPALAADAVIDLETITDGAAGSGYAFSGGVLTLSGSGPFAITTNGNTVADRHIVVSAGVTADVTLNNLVVDISSPDTCAFDITGATVNLTLTGENTLKSGENRAGLEVPAGATLTVTAQSTGKLAATGGWAGAGIGGGRSADGGNMTVLGGDITAVGKCAVWYMDFGGGAGIGGGGCGDTSARGGNGGVVVIDGGTVNATGGACGAGIGGGCGGSDNGGNSGNVTIKKGTVRATGIMGSAGIGGGWYGGGGQITILGGDITAIGSGGEHPTRGECGGAGIGGGSRNSDAGTIVIKGGKITASGGANAAGIGGGIPNWGSTETGSILIEGGEISAAGGGASAGIGGGLESTGISITITNGNITARGNMGGAGIGGGLNGNGGEITITGGEIDAQGSGGEHPTRGEAYAAGIGGGVNGSAGTIRISGGNIKATGKFAGAGIGGNGGSVEITGGTVTAIGGEYDAWYCGAYYYGAGIGGAYRQNGIQVTISGLNTSVSAKGNWDIGSGSEKTDGGTLRVGGGATLEMLSTGSNAVSTFTDCTITGSGAVLQGIKGLYDAYGKRVITPDMISHITDKTYTGNAFAPAVIVTNYSSLLTEDTDYTVSYSHNINAGTAAVIVEGKGNYSGTAVRNFAILPKTGFSVGDIAAQTYTGSAVIPQVAVADGKNPLIKDQDYTVTCSNHINAGTATAVISGKGNYTGTVTKTFAIHKKQLQVFVAIVDKAFDGTASATAVPTLIGVADADQARLYFAEQPVYTFCDASPGTGKTVDKWGEYSLAGEAHSNYQLIQPEDGLTATILKATPEVKLKNQWKNGRIVFTATVKGVRDFVPTGIVTFKNGRHRLETLALDENGEAVCICKHGGKLTLTVEYAGDICYAAASNRIKYAVNSKDAVEDETRAEATPQDTQNVQNVQNTEDTDKPDSETIPNTADSDTDKDSERHLEIISSKGSVSFVWWIIGGVALAGAALAAVLLGIRHRNHGH